MTSYITEHIDTTNIYIQQDSILCLFIQVYYIAFVYVIVFINNIPSRSQSSCFHRFRDFEIVLLMSHRYLVFYRFVYRLDQSSRYIGPSSYGFLYLTSAGVQAISVTLWANVSAALIYPV